MKRKKNEKNINRNFLIGGLILAIIILFFGFISPSGFLAQPKGILPYIDEILNVPCDPKGAFDVVDEIARGNYRCDKNLGMHFCQDVLLGRELPGNNRAVVRCADQDKERLFIAKCNEFYGKICG